MKLHEHIKLFGNSFLSLIKEYNKYCKQNKFHRCKIVNIEKDLTTGKNLLWVIIFGLKNQIPIKFYPEEIILINNLLMEFSQIDVRTITFYALKNNKLDKDVHNHCKGRSKIISQEISANKTFFTIKKIDSGVERKISSEELFTSDILHEFELNDIKNIIYSAVSEEKIRSNEMQEFLITSQEFVQEKTIFVIFDINQKNEFRMSAQEVLSSEMINNFCVRDVKNIIYTALSEQGI